MELNIVKGYLTSVTAMQSKLIQIYLFFYK